MADRSFRIEYYKTRRGDSPVQEFLESLQEGTQAKADARTLLLRERGLALGRPCVELVRGGIRALRARFARDKIRVLFVQIPGGFVLLNAFRKRTNKIPAVEIELAEGRLAEWLTRGDGGQGAPSRSGETGRGGRRP